MDGDSMTRKITTTINPDTEIEVSEDEFLDLKNLGLVKEDKTPKKDLPKENANNA
jgi:hypothetical protein